MSEQTPESHDLQLDKDGHVAILTLNTGPANTIDLDMLTALRKQIEQLTSDDEVWALVFMSGNARFFSAGADLNQFQDIDSYQATTLAKAFGAAFEAISSFEGLTVAALNGYTMGSGLELALACDLRVADHETIMALPEPSVGLLPCAGGTQNLTRLVGEGWAKRMILCGERMNAQQALSIGLIEEVTDSISQAQTRALTLAQAACKLSPIAMVNCKTLIQHTRSGTHATGLMRERDLFVDLFRTEDQKEGVAAFLEKRTPKWHNR